MCNQQFSCMADSEGGFFFYFHPRYLTTFFFTRFTMYLCIKKISLNHNTLHLCHLLNVFHSVCVALFVVFSSFFYSVLNQVCFVILSMNDYMKYTVFYCVALISCKYTKASFFCF